MKIKLDDTDFKIMAHIRENARKPLKAIAREIGLHHNTLLQRVRRLERTGVITKYVAAMNYENAGMGLHMIILMKVKKGRPGDTLQLSSIMKMKELEALYATTGVWDVFSMWRVKDREHLNDILRQLAGNPSVSKTLSHIVLYAYKEPDSFNPFSQEAKIHHG